MIKQLVLAVVVLVCSAVPAPAASGNPISSDPHARTSNPRFVRISNGEEKGTIVASFALGTIYKSTDDGSTFTKVTDIPFQSITSWKCCGTLFELPQQVGALQAGTLLFAATFCAGTTASLDVYSSSDEGKTWRYHSTPVQRGNCNNNSNDGLWEPQFEVDSGGSLIMFWSDETDPCCSQKLAQIRSNDGVSWQDEKNTVASDVQSDRPGMAVVSRLPGGTYFMTYELCGPAQCTAFFRTSQDGWNFGPPSDTGKKIETASGEYFEHAPTNHWIPASQSDNAALLVVGQLLYEKNGKVSPKSGKVLFVNHTRDASGNWEEIPAPVKVEVTAAPYNVCQNYSSVLLPTREGSALLEMASDFNALHVCSSYYASEPRPASARAWSSP